jgi:hypothetical protein
MQEVDHKTGKDKAHMSYENAPATKLLATHCCICGRPLVEALSIETGIGPICREESGYDVDAAPEARATVNAIVYRIAAGIPLDELIPAIETIRAFGFAKLADTLLKRKATVTIEDRGDGTLAVHTPYHSDFVSRLKTVTPWRKWSPEIKAWVISRGGEDTARKLWTAIKWCFPGALVIGPKGAKVTPSC